MPNFDWAPAQKLRFREFLRGALIRLLELLDTNVPFDPSDEI